MNPKFGLIGKHLGHSFSKDYFTGKFREMRLRASYQNFELESIDNLRMLLETEPDLMGFNVTIPYKTSIVPYLSELSPIASAVGAVNTVRVENGRLVGAQYGCNRLSRYHEPVLPGATWWQGPDLGNRWCQHGG